MRERPSGGHDDLERPSAARICDFLLGGAANFAVDRAFARRLRTVFPDVGAAAWANRELLGRIIRFLNQQGIRQFLDLGSGIPTLGAAHEVAHALDPDLRVVSVDLDDLAVTYGDYLLGESKTAAILRADLRRPATLAERGELTGILDCTEPIGVLALSSLHFIPDSDDPAAVLRGYRRMLPAGSYLALSHATADQLPEATEAAALYAETGMPMTLRDERAVAALMTGFDLVPPGVAPAPEWHPDSAEQRWAHPQRAACYAAVGRLP